MEPSQPWPPDGLSNLHLGARDRLKQARRRFEAGEVDAAGLREVEDEEIRAAVGLQEGPGLGW